jgi:hypothetical protein
MSHKQADGWDWFTGGKQWNSNFLGIETKELII